MLSFESKAIAEHSEVPLADEGRLEDLVEHWNARRERRPLSNDAQSGAVYVASVGAERDPRVRSARLSEIVSLVLSQGARIVGQESCHLAEPNPRTLLGKGTARELADRARACGATLLVLDAELSPSQMRNLEDATGIPISDREGIILNVFLRHAKTRRARIQVELAQLEYLRPRIRGMGLDMDQQAGYTTGGRGPGETASELLARKLDGRLSELKKALERLEISARTQRQRRDACQRLVLVGYTNAGKTSLMNALTQETLSACDRPFETLDTTSRCLTRHGGEVVISDTVGFIRQLPSRLLASFESTLTEIHEASLLVVVVDLADYERDLKLRTTHELIERLGAKDVPRFYVFNKLDRLPAPPAESELTRSSGGAPWVTLSSRDRAAVDELARVLIEAARRNEPPLSVVVPYHNGRIFALIYGNCQILESEATDVGLALRIRGPANFLAQIQAGLKEAQ